VGPPVLSHYTPTGELAVSRKAELLLFGLFPWRDYLLVKHSFGRILFEEYFGPYIKPGWFVVNGDDELTITQPLEYSLKTIMPDQDVHICDGNYYDLSDENLIVAKLQKSGRPMECKHCGSRTVPECSRIARVGQKKYRICLRCAKELQHERPEHFGLLRRK